MDTTEITAPLCTNCGTRPLANLGMRAGKPRYHKTKCDQCRRDPGYDEKRLIAWERRQRATDERRRERRNAALVARLAREEARMARKKAEREIWMAWWAETMTSANPVVVKRLKQLQFYATRQFIKR